MTSPPILEEFVNAPSSLFFNPSRAMRLMQYCRIKQLEWFYKKMDIFHPYIDTTYDQIGLGLLRSVLGFWPPGVVGTSKQLMSGPEGS